MKKLPDKQNKAYPAAPRALVMILSTVAVGITLLMLPFSRGKKGGADIAVSSPSPTPSPTAVSVSVEVVLSATPVPAVPPREYPENAVDFSVNGSLICALSSKEEAEALCERYLAYWAEQPLENNEYLVSAEIDAVLTLSAPGGEGTLMSTEEALAYLKMHPSLLPVTRITRTVSLTETSLSDTSTVSEQLPPGVTIIRKLEHPSYMLFYTDREYEGDTLLSRTEAEGFLIGSAATGRITLTGAEPDSAAEPTPTPAPGSLAKECPVSLSVPVKGSVKTRFGRDSEGIMHYGIDYLSESGYAVYAPGEGTVIYRGPRGSLGNVIEIRHDDSGFVSRLIGLDSDITPELYQRVKKGDRLGKVAAAPVKTSPVFRYELFKDGIPVDPLLYIK